MTPDNFAAEMAGLVERVADTNYQGVLEQLEEPFNRGIGENIGQAVNAEGVGWPPRVTESDDHPLLIDTGALLAAATSPDTQFAFTRDSTGMRLFMDTNGPRSVQYAFVHQFGEEGAGDSRINPIPQREFFYASAETQDAMEAIVHREVENILFG